MGLVSQGKKELEQGDFSKALSDLNIAAQLDPKNIEAIELPKRLSGETTVQRAQVDFKAGVSIGNFGQ